MAGIRKVAATDYAAEAPCGIPMTYSNRNSPIDTPSWKLEVAPLVAGISASLAHDFVAALINADVETQRDDYEGSTTTSDTNSNYRRIKNTWQNPE